MDAKPLTDRLNDQTPLYCTLRFNVSASKYSAEYCDIVYFPGNAIGKLRDAYHERTIPRVLLDLMDNSQCVDHKLIEYCPELFTWTECRNFFLRPNVPKYPQEALLERFAHRWRMFERLCLVAWYTHPALLPYVPGLGNTGNPGISLDLLRKMRIRELEEYTDTSFLATPLDLTPDHLPLLLSMRDHVQKELANTYGISSADANMYFHIFNEPRFASLHLQIRVNDPLHYAERSRTFDLDQVIDWLSDGYTFISKMSDTQRSAYFFNNDNPSLMAYLSRTEGSVLYKGVPNPHYK